MPSHATRIHPRSPSLRRTANGRAVPAAHGQAAVPATVTARKRRERTGETAQPRAKLWHIAVGMIALLSSGIELS
ncbi:hypothetical protein [Algiphilus aromaticivorans]|uniref:hypothetical protein n=1 Tax=Algiphilus aromaticivorans TaxID=382454 RepID=UPI0005C1FB86|nr:hypothetical protein [Algiphilus aromaticivorans]